MKLFNPDDIFLGRYKIVQPLGSGGMSEVYLAKDLMLNDDLLAIKFLHLELQNDPNQIRRFQQEVLLTRKISSPYVVKTFDAEISNDHIYFVMEYLEGINLHDLIESQTLDVSQIILILCSIVMGLEAVHEVGIIHRDLKAENILVTKDGQLKIMDFGVAKVQKTNLTIAGEIVGSSCYMSPEVWKGDPVSTKSDVYSLGVLAYQMLTNRFPFDGENMMQIMYQHLEGDIIEPKELNPKTPFDLNELILSMLEVDPKIRPSLVEIKDKLLAMESGSSEQSYHGSARGRVKGGKYDLKISNLSSSSYVAKDIVIKKKESRSSPVFSHGYNWQTIANLKELKKIDFSTPKFLIGMFLSVSFLFFLAFISNADSSGFNLINDLDNFFRLDRISHNIIFHLILFSFIFCLPLFAFLLSTVGFLELIIKFCISFLSFLIILVLVNYSYVQTYLSLANTDISLFSPLFLGYFEVTLPRAIQHLIDVSLLTPVPSSAFISQVNNWNLALVDLLNQPPLIWIFHYNSLVIYLFLIVLINRRNLKFFQISAKKRHYLLLFIFALLVLQPYLKGFLEAKSIWFSQVFIVKLVHFEFRFDEFYLICSFLNWSILIGYLFFTPREEQHSKK